MSRGCHKGVAGWVDGSEVEEELKLVPGYAAKIFFFSSSLAREMTYDIFLRGFCWLVSGWDTVIHPLEPPNSSTVRLCSRGYPDNLHFSTINLTFVQFFLSQKIQPLLQLPSHPRTHLFSCSVSSELKSSSGQTNWILKIGVTSLSRATWNLRHVHHTSGSCPLSSFEKFRGTILHSNHDLIYLEGRRII